MAEKKSESMNEVINNMHQNGVKFEKLANMFHSMSQNLIEFSVSLEKKEQRQNFKEISNESLGVWFAMFMMQHGPSDKLEKLAETNDKFKNVPLTLTSKKVPWQCNRCSAKNKNVSSCVECNCSD